MADVLLISDQPRIKTLFTRASSDRAFSLRTAPTLAQGDEEIAAAPPLCTFFQNSISGLEAGEVARILRSRLPQGSRVIILSADGEGSSAPGGVDETLYLSHADAPLEAAIRAIVQKARSARAEDGPAASLKSAEDILFAAPPEEVRKDAEKAHQCRPVLYTCALVVAVCGVLGAWHYLAAPHDGNTAAPAKMTAVYPKVVATPPPAASGNALAAGYVSYTVVAGDTIQGILLKRFGRSANDLQRLLPDIQQRNNIKDFKTIRPGRQILIPAH